MPVYTGYIGSPTATGRGTLRPGWWENTWRIPVTTQNNQTLTRVQDGSFFYYLANKPSFVVSQNEYPVSIQFTAYSNDGWWCSEDDYDYGSTGTVEIYLCTGNGSVTTSLKKIRDFTWPRGSGCAFTDVMPVLNGQDLTTKNLEIYVNGTRGIWLKGEATVTITTAYIYTKCGAPSNVAVTTPVSGYSDLTWSAGTDGVVNTVTGYQIQYRTSLDQQTWTDWADEGTVDANVLQKRVFCNPVDGIYKQYRVRTLGSAGVDWASDYVESNVIVTDTTPPTFTATVVPIQLNAAVSAGTFIKGMSKLQARVTSASASSPKTIGAYSINAGYYGTSSTDTLTTAGAVDRIGTFAVTFTVTDNCGFSSTQTISFQVLDYYEPTVSVQFARCDSDMTDNPLGMYIKYKATTTHTAVDGNTIRTVLFETNTHTRTLTADGTWRLIDNYTQTAETRKDVTVTVYDKFTSTSVYTTILSANYAIYLNSGGTAIGFGGATEHTNSVEVAQGRTLYVPTKVDAGQVKYNTLVRRGSTSEIRNVAAIQSSLLAAVDSLNPVTYVYTDDTSETSRMGFTYDNVLNVLPRICTQDSTNNGVDYVE